jgi:hypothetical protein
MAANVYDYQDARDMFYTLAGLKSDTENILEGEQLQADAVEDLLHFAEMRDLVLLFPYYRQRMAPQLSTLENISNWAASGAVYNFSSATPAITEYYAPTSLYITNSDGTVCPVVIGDASESWEVASADPFAAPGDGSHPQDFVPALIRNESIQFRVSVGATATSVSLRYIKTPKFPSGTASEMHSSLLEMTVLNMIINYLSIDGEDVDMAVRQTREAQVAPLIQAVSATLGFNPYEVQKLE